MRKSKPHLPPRYDRRSDDYENEVQGFHRIMHVDPPFRDCTLERPVLEPISTHEYRPLGWLWKDKIPLNRLTLIEGPPAVGKLFVALDIAARATRGELGVEQEIVRLREVRSARSRRLQSSPGPRRRRRRRGSGPRRNAECGIRSAE